MIFQLHRWLPKRALVVVGDGSYAVLQFLAAVIRVPQITVITPLRLDAALYDLAPERTAHTKGRPALKGKRQLSLAKRLVDPNTDWQKITVNWYAGVMREVEIVTGTALWYHAGMPVVPISFVLIRDKDRQVQAKGPALYRSKC